MLESDQFGLTSPGGFVIGVQGWVWGEPRPKTITFFLDNTAGVYDQYGRPIRGTMVGSKKVLFAMNPPQNDDKPGARADLATHSQVIAALDAERINWKTLSCAGWPQVPYEELAALIKSNALPPTPLDELRKIADPKLRKDALRARREVDEARVAELAISEDE